MITVIKVETRPELDFEATGIANYAKNILQIPVERVRKGNLYVFDRTLEHYTAEVIGREILADVPSQTYRIIKMPKSPMVQENFDANHLGNWGIRVSYKTDPLMRDDFGLNAREAIDDLDKALRAVDETKREEIFHVKEIPALDVGEVRCVREFVIFGNLNQEQVEAVKVRARLSDAKVHDSIYFMPRDEDET